MPRGENPNSKANLRVLSSEEAREQGRKGGQKSVEIRRQLRTFRELDEACTTDDERKEMLNMLKLKARRGNLKAFEIYRDTMGMNPKDQTGISTEYADDGLAGALEKAAVKVWEDE